MGTRGHGVPRRRVVLLSVLAAAGSLLVMACGLTDTAEPEATPVATEPAAIPLTPFNSAELTSVHEVRDRVVALRGLDPMPDLEEGWIGTAAYADWARAESEAGRASAGELELLDLAALEEAFRLLRIMDADDSLVDEADELQASGIAGFYRSLDRTLVVVGDVEGDLGPFEATLAHEYVHSLQDAAFNAFDEDRWSAFLEADDDDVESTEYATTISCVYEGDAEFLTEQYAAQHPVAPEPVLAEEQQIALDQTSEGLLRWFAFDYVECPEFVRAVHERGGWDAVNALYDRPPATTEQVLHPEKYEADERPTELPLLDLSAQIGASWQRPWSGAFGEYDVFNYLYTALTSDPNELQRAVAETRALASRPGLSDAERAAFLAVTEDDVRQEAFLASIQAAEGWGAGWMSIYRRTDGGGDERVLLHLSLQWDTEQDFNEFLGVYGRVVNVLSGYAVDGDVVHGPARWESERDSGYAEWNPQERTVDILISPQRTVAGAGEAALSAAR